MWLWGAKGGDLNVILFQNNYHKETEMPSLFFLRLYIVFPSLFHHTIFFVISFPWSIYELINREAKFAVWRNRLFSNPHPFSSPVLYPSRSLLYQAMSIATNNTITATLIVSSKDRICQALDGVSFAKELCSSWRKLLPEECSNPVAVCVCCVRHLVGSSSARGTILPWRCRCPITVPGGRRSWGGGSVPGTGLRRSVAFLLLQKKRKM
jgi:hypothetical protein